MNKPVYSLAIAIGISLNIIYIYYYVNVVLHNMISNM